MLNRRTSALVPAGVCVNTSFGRNSRAFGGPKALKGAYCFFFFKSSKTSAISLVLAVTAVVDLVENAIEFLGNLPWLDRVTRASARPRKGLRTDPIFAREGTALRTAEDLATTSLRCVLAAAPISASAHALVQNDIVT
eukprot:1184377-Prorocentrum_minimum.AAC.2